MLEECSVDNFELFFKHPKVLVFGLLDNGGCMYTDEDYRCIRNNELLVRLFSIYQEKGRQMALLEVMDIPDEKFTGLVRDCFSCCYPDYDPRKLYGDLVDFPEVRRRNYG